MTKYKIIIYWSEEDQTYIAEVPELAGCMADGSSYQEAVSNAERVVAEWIDTAIAQGRYIPEPKGQRLFTHCCAIARKHPLIVVICIMLVVFSFYFANFHNGFSDTKGDWGTFGDYVGGILNPVIAAFAFYLIAETYKLQIKAYDLQKTELAETRKLLKVSTDAQNDQVKLAALTALLNSNLTKISLLCSERIELLDKTPGFIRRNIGNARSNQIIDTKNFGPDEDAAFDAWIDENHHILKYIDEINYEIKKLTENNDELKKQINDFLKEETK